MSQEAQELLSQAVQAENSGNIQTAFETYHLALTILFEDVKNETNENKRVSLQKIIAKYMDVAENLKKELNDNKTSTASSSSSKQTSSLSGKTNSDKDVTKSSRVSILSSSSTKTTNASTTNKTPSKTKQELPDYHDYSLPTVLLPLATVPTQKPAPPRLSSATRQSSRASSQPSTNITPSKRVTSSVNTITTNTPTISTSTINKPALPAAARGSINKSNNNITATPSSNKQKPLSGAANASEDNKLSEFETQIQNEMLDTSPGITWDDIAGLSFAKQTLQEAVILPNLRPDLFTGLRAPPRGVLLFGPPGTGKTLLAKAVATESGFSFFSITASSVTSKYLGEGEKLMKSLFNVARRVEPAVIFFDEIDALMSSRKDNEHEASRRIKTEFMTQVDGATTGKEERLLIMGATNIPWGLDEAVLRRLVKRIYVPLPDYDARFSLVTHLIHKHIDGVEKANDNNNNNTNTGVFTNIGNMIFGDNSNSNKKNNYSKNISDNTNEKNIPKGFTKNDIIKIVNLTENYSGSDLTAVCHEAAMGPIRELGFAALKTIKLDEVRPLAVKDFEFAVSTIRPSVSPDSLKQYVTWGEQFGVIK